MFNMNDVASNFFVLTEFCHKRYKVKGNETMKKYYRLITALCGEIKQ